jgi:hypothetical protein
MAVSNVEVSTACPLEVVGVEGLFDPPEAERLEGAAHAPGGRAVPLLVRVDHEGDAVPDLLAGGRDPGQVRGVVRVPDLDLDTADATGHRLRRPVEHLLDRRVEEATRGVVAAHRVAVRAQQLGQRQPGLEVPQRDVEGGDRLHRQAAAADRGARPHQLVPVLADVTGSSPSSTGAISRACANCPGPPARLE